MNNSNEYQQVAPTELVRS